jgi:hypothetical protein
MNEFLSIWSELSVSEQIRVGLYLFGILFIIGTLVTLVWNLIPKNRLGYRLVSVPVVITLWLVFMVKMNERHERYLIECRDTWAYQYGGRSCG